jgi:putative membrane protein
MKFLQRLLFSLIGYSLVFWQLDLRYQDLIGTFVQGSFSIEGASVAYVILAGLLSLINSLIKPILMLASLPLRWITLGLFSLIINASLLWVLEETAKLVPADIILHIEHWQTYIVIGLILSFVNGIIHWFER